MKLENVQDVYPLSPMQTGMLFHAIEASEPGLYLLQLRVTLDGPVHFETLRDAWSEVVQRHEALRAAFVWEGLDEPLQVIHERVETRWVRVDASAPATGVGLGEDGQGGDPEAAWLAEDRREGFDLTQAPLMRLALLKLGPERHRLVWTFHHLLADAWSMAVVMQELHAIYHALRAGREPALSPAPAYRDFIGWLKARDLDAAKASWQRYLEGVRQPMALRFPAQAASGSVSGRQLETRILSQELGMALTALAQAQRVTPTALYLAAWGIVL
ncbi:MAG: condensation domain-containing protein, partial [Pseudomonadota bacterium]